MAGESAEEVARAAREKAERLLRHSAAYAKGAAGERATAEILASLPESWIVLHDLRWPGRQRANIDHVAIGPTGVFVIDSKNWAGTVTVTGDVLRQNGYSRGPALSGATEAATAIAGLVPSLRDEAFRPVLCLVRDDELLTEAAGVTVCTTATLVPALTDRPVVLSSEWLDFLRFDLDMSTRSATDPTEPLPPLPRRPARTNRPAPAPSRRARTVSSKRSRAAARRRQRRRSDLVASMLGLVAAGAILIGVDHYAHVMAGRQVPAHQPAVVHHVHPAATRLPR